MKLQRCWIREEEDALVLVRVAGLSLDQRGAVVAHLQAACVLYVDRTVPNPSLVLAAAQRPPRGILGVHG